MKPDADFRAQVEPITFVGGEFDWKAGWYVSEVDGLNSGASASADEQARVGGEGQHDLPNLLTDARSIFLKGRAYAPTMGELGRMARLQGALLAMPEQLGAFTWLEFGEQFTVDVRRGPNWSFRRDGDSGFADFQVRFRAPSQKFYGLVPETGTGTTVEVQNRGTVPSAPIITVTGDMPSGYNIHGPGGRVYQVGSGLTPGAVDVIDMRGDGLLVRNGIPAVGVYGQRIDTWTIPAGGSAVQTILTSAGSGQMTVSVPPAYV